MKSESSDKSSDSEEAKCECQATCLIVDDNIFNSIPLQVALEKLAKIKVLIA